MYGYSKYLEDLDDDVGEGEFFNAGHVKQIRSASILLCKDMCKSSSVSNSSNLNTTCLNKPSITKEQLIEWLYSAVFLLDRCSLPLMGFAFDQFEELEELKNEKINDQKKIIDLQGKLIKKKDNELCGVQKTVQDELKSYSSVLQKGCTEALAPDKIATVVQKVNEEVETRNNLIVFGITEEQTEDLDSRVNGLLEQLHEKPKIMSCSRIGLKKSGKTRPIRFAVRNPDIAYHILRKAKTLKDVAGYQSIYISPDRTVEEQKTQRELVLKLKEKRQNDQSTRYVIRGGKIVSLTN